ncbi:MAG: ATP-dependent helicase, partial [Candidatus Limnocylindrales bacterium]
MTVTPPAPQAEGQGPAISAEEPSGPYAAGPPILTEEQEHIVRWDGGPLMVLAGAGTGKTTVIVERVRHLLATEADLLPEHVLVLTYNVKAARELVERFERALGPEVAGRLWVQNFHSFGHRVLRDAAAEVGLPERVEVLDSVGQRLFLRELRPGLDLLYHDRGGDPYAQLGHFADLINRAKDELVTPAEYRDLAVERRRGFEARHGMGAYDQTIAGLRMRGDLRAARQVQRAFAAAAAGSLATAAATAAAAPAATRSKVATAAGREARREVRGDGYAGYWTDLDPQQRQLADGLQATFERDGEALDVRRLLEEAEVYAAYQEALAARGALDFGEQILRVIALFETRPNILRRYQRQFRHILVDEFQDANMAQILLLELLGRSPDRPDQVVVVGDDDQSIYRFRGASYAAFRQFKDRFERPPAWDSQRTTTRIGTVETRDLLRNRRSTGHILTAATRLIEKNAGRLKEGRRLRTVRPDGGPVELVYAGDPADQATAVVDWIQQVAATLPPRLELPDGSSRPRRWSDIAVLYRKHQHREAIVERLREAGIPAVVTGGIGLFVQPEIRDLEAALRVLVDPEDSISFTRLLSAGPWRLDAAEILRLTRAAAHDRRPVSEAAREIRRAGELLVDVVEEVGDDGLGTPAAPAELPHRHRLERLDDLLRAKLERLLDCLDALAPRANREGPFTLLDEYLVRTSILRDLLAVGTTEAQKTVLAVARLLRFTAGWQRERPLGSLADFIAYLDIYQQVGGDPDVEPGGQVEVEGVQLMTVYQAKGLEFEAVVVPWLTEGQFPDERKEQLLIPVELLKQTPPDEFVVAEERRLGYVAMTRARSRLLLVAVDGVRERPSRFAEEIAPGGRAAARIPGPTASDGGVPAEGSPTEAVLATGARYRVAHRGDVTVIDRAADEAEQGSLQREPPPLAADADAIAARTEARLERLLPVPAAFERRFALRRRAVELIGALEQLAAGDEAGRARLLDELVAVAADAAHAAE